MAADIESRIGARIKERRRAAGLSQEKLGVALGVTFQQVQKFENGKNRIAASQLFTVAGALGVEVADFFVGIKLPKRNRRAAL